MTTLICPKCKAQLDLSLTPARAPDGPPWRRVPIEDLELSVRAHNCLHNMGCETAGEVADTTDKELLRTPNFGWGSLREVREQIARLKAGEPLR